MLWRQALGQPATTEASVCCISMHPFSVVLLNVNVKESATARCGVVSVLRFEKACRYSTPLKYAVTPQAKSGVL